VQVQPFTVRVERRARIIRQLYRSEYWVAGLTADLWLAKFLTGLI